jgi:hypothetical protein
MIGLSSCKLPCASVSSLVYFSKNKLKISLQRQDRSRCMEAGPQGFEPWMSGLFRSPAPKADTLIRARLRALLMR